MDQETEQLIADSFKKLPPELQKAVAAIPLSTIVQDIANKKDLHIDQSGALYAETLLVLIGVEKLTDLATNIKTGLAIDDNLTQLIVNELNERVFKEIRKFLQEPAAQIENTPTEPITTPPVNPERERTLYEIENPKPVTPSTIPRGPEKPWEITKQQITKDFNASKQQTPDTQIKQNSGPDPYREIAK